MKRVYRINIFLLAFVLSFNLNAQNKTSDYKDKKASSFYSVGLKYYSQHVYTLAEQNLAIWMNKNVTTTDIDGLSALANSYWINRKYKNAHQVYHKLKNALSLNDFNSMNEAVKRISDLEAMMGEYDSAAQMLNDINLFKRKKEGFLQAGSFLDDSLNWTINYLDINSDVTECLPYVYNNKFIVTTDRYSTKKNLNIRTYSNFSKLGYFSEFPQLIKEIDYSKKIGSIDSFAYTPVEKVKQLALLHENGDIPLLNKSFLYKNKKIGVNNLKFLQIEPNFTFNIGSISIQKPDNDKDKPEAYFVGNNPEVQSTKVHNKDNTTEVPINLYRGNYDDGKSGVKGVSINNAEKMVINGFKGILINASVSKDGKIIVFSGKENSADDNFDLFYATRLNENSWDSVHRFGSNINTAGDEVFPQIQNDGTLFFSSDGLPGLGALDIYYIPLFYTNGKLNTNLSNIVPEHFGYPVNSAFDDYGVAITNEPEGKNYNDLDSLEGYFTTNRLGTDDICHFKYKTKWVVYFGKVYGKNTNGTSELLPGTSVFLYKIDNNNDTAFVQKAQTDSLGNYSFTVQLNHLYQIRAEKESWLPGYLDFQIGIPEEGKLLHNIYLNKEVEKEIFVSNNKQSTTSDDIKRYIQPNEQLAKSWIVHHEFDNTDVVEEDKNILDSVETYFKSHPDAVVRIYSTADCFGAEDYNNRLAKDRSISIKNNLVEHGVDKFVEIVGIGKGERMIGCPEVRDSENIARQVLKSLYQNIYCK